VRRRREPRSDVYPRQGPREGRGFYKPYATSHDELDGDTGLHEEVRNAARSLIQMVRMIRSGRYVPPDRDLREPRPK